MSFPDRDTRLDTPSGNRLEVEAVQCRCEDSIKDPVTLADDPAPPPALVLVVRASEQELALVRRESRPALSNETPASGTSATRPAAG